MYISQIDSYSLKLKHYPKCHKTIDTVEKNKVVCSNSSTLISYKYKESLQNVPYNKRSLNHLKILRKTLMIKNLHLY